MKKLLALLLTASVLTMAAFSQAALARDPKAVEADKTLARTMLAECAKVLGAEGAGFDALVAAVNKADARFVKGSIYVTVGGFDGTMYAHPVPALQGKQFPLTLPDADGKPMQMVSTARDKGKGEIEYRFSDSVLKKVVRKWAIVQRIPNHDAYISIAVNLEE